MKKKNKQQKLNLLKFIRIENTWQINFIIIILCLNNYFIIH